MAGEWDVVSVAPDAPTKPGEWDVVKTEDAPPANAEGGSFGARAMASVRQTVEGKVSLLQNILGADNVRVKNVDEPSWVGQPDTNKPGYVPTQTIEIKDEKSGRFVPFDESGFSFKDVTADAVGPVIEAVPALAGGPTVIGAGVGAAAGQSARQMISDALPGQEGMSTGERLTRIGTSAAIAAGIQGAVNTGAWAFDAIRNIPSKFARKAASSSYAAEGRQLSADTGVPLSIGEETGSRAIKMVEDTSRQTLSAADKFAEFHQKQLHAAVDNLGRQMDALSSESGALTVGTRIQGAFDNAVDKAFDLRRMQGETDFGAVKTLSGGKPVVEATGLTKTIDDMIAEYDIPGAGDAAQSVVRGMKTLRQSLLKETVIPGEAPSKFILPGPLAREQATRTADTIEQPRLTAEQTNRLLQWYTKLQRGKGTLLQNQDKAQSQLMAGKLKDALLSDLDQAATTGADDVVTALKKARDNWKLNSKVVNELDDSKLAHIIGDGKRQPEDIAGALLKLKPSGIRQAMDVIEASNPAAAQAVKRHFLEKAADDAIPPTTQATANGLRFSAARFVSALPERDKLVAAGFKPAELRQIDNLSKTLERVSNRALSGSQTAPMLLVWDTIKGVFTLNVKGVAQNLATMVLVPRKIAKASLTQEGRQALMTLSQTSKPTKAALAAAAYLSAVAGTEDEE